MGKRDYEVIQEYELGLAPWTPEIEQAYLRMYASFVFGEGCLDKVPIDWWEQHRKEYIECA